MNVEAGGTLSFVCSCGHITPLGALTAYKWHEAFRPFVPFPRDLLEEVNLFWHTGHKVLTARSSMSLQTSAAPAS